MKYNPVIEPSELHELMNTEAAIKMVDATYVMPGSAEMPFQNYLTRRIGNAVFFDIDEISDHSTDLPHMLPQVPAFEYAVSNMGISNGDLIVIYGQGGMVMGPARAWWTFRVFGHDNVRVLNGGLPAWLVEKYPLNTEPPTPPARTVFKSSFRPYLVKTLEQIQDISDKGNACLLDARPVARFNGSAPEPRPGMRGGHIPGSKSLPCMNLIETGTSKIKSRADIESQLDALGLNPDLPVTASCGSGVTACMIALAFAYLGRPDVAVYDGSWSEWGRADSLTKVSTL